ncbi:hypothetical protein [Vibrio sp. D431a]|uniref:capsular polysaccharide export protein, LipB/KpsS family n=1 Tax=Vibrio sp. D431a TaxID=2837388 RepID=UPI002554B2A7|nr:hypothetical protein [Vibrio sp. D431a]MDK9790726.1 hypothetical protein [Vibrio sp. D431a]
MKCLSFIEKFDSSNAKRLIQKNTTFSVPREELLTNGKRTIVGVRISDWKRDFLIKVYPEFNWVFLGFKVKVESMEPLIQELSDPVFVFWGYNEFECCHNYVKSKGYDVWRMEDGFLRSIGLGANHNLPMSLVIDKTGTLYFDPRKESGLEKLIVEGELSSSELIKAKELISQITDCGISKYNTCDPECGKSYYNSFAPKADGQKRILVIGQVEDDASIVLGGCGHSNGSLVYEARLRNPDAQIFFKPHPDVLAGKRKIETPLSQIENVAHIIDNNMSLSSSFESIDEVYVISSLAGFEALLHKIPVTVLGQPFYAGWGLTNDVNPIERRERNQSKLPESPDERLNHLFGMAYIKYPDYFNTLTQTKSGVDETTLALKIAVKLRNERFARTVKKNTLSSQVLLNS